MQEESPKRFDRLVAIYTQLQSKRIIKAQELADRFGVSLRTIYRDVRSLESSGIPIIGEAGTGYAIMEGYKLPPVMFTREEALSFVAAEKIMQHYTDKSLGEYFGSAMYKIKSVLRMNEKDWVDTLDAQILVQPGLMKINAVVNNAMELLMHSIIHRRQAHISYQAFEAEKPAARMIEPIGLYHENSYWYLLAYCHLRKDYRKFRTDRILKIEKTETDFILQHESLAYYLKAETSHYHTVEIKILIKKSTAKYLQRSKHFYGYRSELELPNGMIEMLFEAHEDLEYFARWYLMFGDSAQIVQPQQLKDEVFRILEKHSRNLGEAKA